MFSVYKQPVKEIKKKYCTQSRREATAFCKSKVYNSRHIQEVGYTCSLKHREYKWPALEQSHGILISDSICKYINKLKYLDVHAFPGCTLEMLFSKIITREILLDQYQLVILHVGTNNLSNCSSSRIIALYMRIVRYIKYHYPIISLSISGMLPRIDDPILKSRMEINKFLQYMSRKERQFTFLRTHRCLIHKDKTVKSHLYGKDGIHLNQAGVAALTKYYIGSSNKLH